MVSVQLTRSFFMRLFFGGIGVARQKDREDSSRNDDAIRDCIQLLAGGGALIVFPEGTSDLGPRHLPFKSGAARIAVAALAQGVPLKIIPMGIHYERAWAFRSKVDVVVGEALDTVFSEDLNDAARLKEMKRRINASLEAVGVNFASEEEQVKAETLAYASTLGTSRNYFTAIKALESGIPDDLENEWNQLADRFSGRRPIRHQRVALFPGKSRWLYAAALPVFGLPVILGLVLNAPPLLIAAGVAWKLADARNVIALWRILVGLPLLVIWVLGMVVFLGIWAAWWWAAAYLLISVISLETIYRTKKVGASVWNAFVHAPLSKPSWELHRKLDESLPSS